MTDDLGAEQARLDDAYQHLATMRERTDAAVAVATHTFDAEGTADAEVAKVRLERRAEQLGDDNGPLCFGRIDTEDAEQWYVGRRHVEDGDGHPFIVDWRAPVSAAFYRATAADPFGLAHRRRFSVEGRTIAALFDEDLTDPESLSAAGIPDPLLAELDRSRTGRMGDIVATIAAEQDEIIRAPLAELLVVQGGPGTGKTAVGLHRAAFLLFQHRVELSSGPRGTTSDAGVLVLGPNPLFLRYISNVLPSLGEVSVRQATLSSLLAARYRIRGHDTAEARAIKGRRAMAVVVAAAVRAAIKIPDDGIELRAGLAVVRFSADEIAELVKSILRDDPPLNKARTGFRNRLAAEAWKRHRDRPGTDPGAEPTFSSQLQSDQANKKVLDKLWPTVNGAAVIRRLYSSPAALRRASVGVLNADEQAVLRRPAPRRGQPDLWTEADVWLLDEADERCDGLAITYSHIVVDEAQDLAPMALRMVGRRSERGSMTILGDLAQATSANAVSSWNEAVSHLLEAGSGSGTATNDDARGLVHHTELTVGYRVPESIIELANRLLPEAAPTVTPVASVRSGGEAPLIQRCDGDGLEPSAAGRVAALTARGFSTAVIAHGDRHRLVGDALDAAGLVWADADAAARSTAVGGEGGDRPVAVLDPATAKGLEFDAVVVVEPAEIAAPASGLRHLYVAMTRAVQHLSVVHARDLPAALTSS